MTGMEVCLGDIVTIGRGSSPRPIKDEKYFKDGSIPWVKIADATASGKYIIQTKQFVNEYGASFSRHLKKGSLIISASGTLGTPYFLGVDACIHDGWLYFSDYAGVEPEWLYYKLMTLKEYFNGISYGAAIQNINTDIVRETKIFLPDLEIQAKQVQILKSIDDLSRTYEDRIRIYESVLEELYNSWFINFKFPNHEQVEFVDGIPEGWEYNELIELFVLQRGFDLSNSKRILGDIPIYASTGIVGYHNENKVLEKTVITGRSGSLGEVMITNGPSWPLNTTLWVKEFKKFTPEMAYFTLKNLELESFNAGAAVPTLNRNDVHKVKILTPTKEIINEFSKLASQIFDQIHLLKLKNEKLVELKETLLPRLMSGELYISKLSSIE
ncbi:restriction endonuclease subunit S [Acinetobacter soli]|uniref:restriction endonuclease subunit S n=1 Tax=Acinetobacter soli TaxID=487316 RepID=UPI001F2C43E0|nr:restriction endonuclease subunit S [Acinetobacter soli]MCE6006023.1 restriction endonuclease subunit S [Acinetobacter soli]